MRDEFTIEDNEGNEIELPTVKAVCPRCDGHGSHTNPSIDGNGITSSEWSDDWDDEERDAYMRGDYDVTCEECQGRNVVDVVNEGALDPETLALWREWQESVADSRRTAEAERRMGA